MMIPTPAAFILSFSFGNMTLFTATNLQHNCTLQRVSKSSKGDDNLHYLGGLFRCGVHAILPIGLAFAFAPKVTKHDDTTYSLSNIYENLIVELRAWTL
jgi:hypothetical protein